MMGDQGFIPPLWLVDQFAAITVPSPFQRMLETQADARRNGHIGPIHHPNRSDWWEVMRPVWRREHIREVVADLMPGRRPGQFIRSHREVTP